MNRSTAAQIEGLPERSITDYADSDIRRTGVRNAGGDLGMQARVTAFGMLMAIEAWGTGGEVERRPLRPGLPTIDIVFVQEGSFEYLQGGAWQRSSSALMIAPSGLPHRVRFVEPWRFHVLRIPREALLAYVPMLIDQVMLFDELTVSERAMLAFLEQSISVTEDTSERERFTVDRMLLEMAGTLIIGRQGGPQQAGSPRAALREKALQHIAEHRSEVQLTPQMVAQFLGVSLRRLQAVFAEAESSVAGEIRRERARVARSMLQDARFDEADVSTIAEQTGFGTSASMRRALKELYGLAPRELRNGR